MWGRNIAEAAAGPEKTRRERFSMGCNYWRKKIDTLAESETLREHVPRSRPREEMKNYFYCHCLSAPAA